ncbi:hypothetical protein QAD02_006350 [Eretmocerus hayati]|uniref:Uncharacterized protein n=1 Tax=Eretmocerus hayati TaxID=131215 RepID=A0ACC2N0N4_9HYME|nr:hypothetical protein QAD02_006350 [Eretmocerus hayati]
MTEPVIVETKQGRLKGTIRQNIDGGEYFSFRGVPYAEPPIGDLRFREPHPPRSWNGIRDALEDSKMCAQYEVMSKVGEGGDDCLYLDIATESITEKWPVMVWIHGGAFKKSSNTYKKYSPEYLIKKKIVFVGINYRLGVLGFLNMRHKDCSGNMGLKDQVAALKWVQENIQNFGGDPNNVTIFGESAGGASVHSLCISPKAKGLFHKAIIQSGVLSNPWAHISTNRIFGHLLAQILGRESSKSTDVIEFLKTIPPLDLVKSYEDTNPLESINLVLHLVPSLELNSSDPILPGTVLELEKNGIDVPVMIGYNSHEGILRFVGQKLDFIKEINDDLEVTISDHLRIYDPVKLKEITAAVRKFYFGDDEIDESKIDELVQFFGDLLFVNDIHRVVDYQMLKNSPTYFYKFSYSPDFPGIKQRFNVDIKGTCHGDELGCLFYSEMRRGRLEEGTRDRITMERMTTMWTNFAKFGNPTPTVDDLITTKWLPVGRNEKNFLEINDTLTAGKNPDEKMYKMWKSLSCSASRNS